MIDRAREQSVTLQTKLLDLSRAAVHDQATPISDRDLALMRLIDEIHLEQRTGVRVVCFASCVNMREPSAGLTPNPLGRKHVAMLMKRMGIEALCPKPGTSRKSRGRGHTAYPYLLRYLPISEANQVWTMDTTSVPMRHGFVYLILLIDVASCRVLAQAVHNT